jgi:hypothetical protein
MLTELIPYANATEEIKIYRLIGFSYIKDGEWNKAIPWFSRVTKDTVVASDLFHLAICQIHSGEFQEGIETFAQMEMVHNDHPSQETSFYVHLFWFMMSLINGGKIDLAVPYVKRLIGAYERARFTDVKFLNDVGLPDFEEFIRSVAVIGRKFPDIIQELKKISLDERGNALINTLEDPPKYANPE